MRFQVIPSIDLREGRCVRLFQGDYARETRYPGDPVEVARRWASAGADILHIVDLDGAKAGAPANATVMASICEALPIPVEVSGGLRTMADIEAAFAYGAGRVQLGSIAVRDPVLVRQACTAFPGGVVVSLDARDGEVMTDGWTAGGGVKVEEMARRMVDLGVPRLMFTDISHDGAMRGPNVDALRALAALVPVPVVASGGVTAIEHLHAIAEAGCEGAIIGRALYEGAIDLRAAIEAFAAR